MNILLATDGSSDALAATRYLKQLPLRDDARVLVLSVAAVPATTLEVPLLASVRDAALADARRVTEKALAILGPRLSVEPRVAEGDPRDEIVRTAEDWKADLVVVGARGLTAVKRFLIGSVSLAVARHAPCPVLVVKGKPTRLRNVVAGVDGSEGSTDALRFFASLGLRSVDLHLLAVVEPLRFPTTAPVRLRRGLRGMFAKEELERMRDCENILDRAESTLAATEVELTREVGRGAPADVILATATRLRADLVMVGARGPGAVKRVLLGSVSERVLGHASCPVLIVRP